jgi:drug/metabolite transporter (DMT)-like permease
MDAASAPSKWKVGLGYALLCGIWGSTWLAIRIAVQSIAPLRAASLRFAAAAIVLAAVIAVRRLPMPRRRELFPLFVLSIAMMALPYGLLFWAERRIPSSTTALLFSSMPLLTALLTPWMSERSVPRQALFAIVIGFTGILVIFSGALSASFESLLGGIAVLGAVASSAWASLYAKRHTPQIHPAVATAAQLAIGAVALWLMALLTEPHTPTQWTRFGVLAMGFLVIFGSVIAFSVYYWLLRYLEPYQVSTISLIVPVIAIFEGAAFESEPIPLSIIAATALILFSVGFVLRAPETGAELLSVVQREHA